MEKLNFSHLGHNYLNFANPLSEKKIEEAVSFCKGRGLARAVEIGAGNGYLLKKFVGQVSENAIGVDLTQPPEPQQLPEEIKFIEQDASEFVRDQADGSFDLAICIAACHALGGYDKTLTELRRLVRTGGLIVVGDGYWLKPPSQEYLEFLGGTEDELHSHHGNLLAAEKLTLTPLWARTASLEEWDHYEWSYSTAIEDYFLQHPDHPQKDEFLQKISRWRQGVWQWGRETLGFGLYILRK